MKNWIKTKVFVPLKKAGKTIFIKIIKPFVNIVIVNFFYKRVLLPIGKITAIVFMYLKKFFLNIIPTFLVDLFNEIKKAFYKMSDILQSMENIKLYRQVEIVFALLVTFLFSIVITYMAVVVRV